MLNFLNGVISTRLPLQSNGRNSRVVRTLVSMTTAVLLISCLNLGSSNLSAQQILVETPFNTMSDSFYENHGVNFNFFLPGGTGNGSRIVGNGPGGMGNNIGFSQGSFGVVPPFGGYDPNANLNTGFGYRNGNGGGFNLGLSLGKGSSRSNVTQAPSVMVQNGYGGSIFDGSVRPFVTGVIPIVGGANGRPEAMYTPVASADNAVTRAINSGQLKIGGPVPERESTYTGPRNFSNEASSAQYGDESVAAIKARKAQAAASKTARLDSLIAEAKALEAEGKYLEARSKYRVAIVEAKDRSKKKELRASLNAIRGK